jgi:hypothetical protein
MLACSFVLKAARHLLHLQPGRAAGDDSKSEKKFIYWTTLLATDCSSWKGRPGGGGASPLSPQDRPPQCDKSRTTLGIGCKDSRKISHDSRELSPDKEAQCLNNFGCVNVFSHHGLRGLSGGGSRRPWEDELNKTYFPLSFGNKISRQNSVLVSPVSGGTGSPARGELAPLSRC